jgi:hypothetical protein
MLWPQPFTPRSQASRSARWDTGPRHAERTGRVASPAIAAAGPVARLDVDGSCAASGTWSTARLNHKQAAHQRPTRAAGPIRGVTGNAGGGLLGCPFTRRSPAPGAGRPGAEPRRRCLKCCGGRAQRQSGRSCASATTLPPRAASEAARTDRARHARHQRARASLRASAYREPGRRVSRCAGRAQELDRRPPSLARRWRRAAGARGAARPS